MPERVRKVFDDNVDVHVPQPEAPPSAVLPVGSKKRKRHQQNDVPTQAKEQSREVVDRRSEKSKENRKYNGTKSSHPAIANDHINRLVSSGNASNRGKRHLSLKEKRDALLPFRRSLPVWSQSQRIKDSLEGSKDVLLLVAETGSGKSTQIPQFLLEEDWCTGCIAITQPRRVAATSLAKRVAEEMGTPLGSSSPASKVGYSVRFDTSISPSTRIKFLTEGMLLQEILRDPLLKKYSAVIVDEVHERSVNVDLILGFLRNLVFSQKSTRNGKPLKVVVMSATANADQFHSFFTEGLSNSLEANVPMGDAVEKITDTTLNSESRISTCFIQGRQFPVDVTYLSEPTEDFVEAALKMVFQIHYKEPLPGDILVFLTGQDAVESLERLINEYAENMDPEVPKARVRD
jgi:ATP-dependent RNA helicase DHR2